MEGASMTRKSKKASVTPTVRIDPKLMEALAPGPLTPAEANELIQGFKKASFERALGAESGREGRREDQVFLCHILRPSCFVRLSRDLSAGARRL
jgi:hypothetical protein